MPNLRLADLTAEIENNVRRALLEDVGSGDITAQLIPAERLAKATIITRDDAVICGTAWVDAVFRQLDPRVAVHWQVVDGQRVKANQPLFHLEGPARSLLTGERSALNFLQLLSGVATRAQYLADFVGETQVKLLDTRKNPARPADGAEICGDLRRLPQPSHRSLRCLPDQGKPHRRQWWHRRSRGRRTQDRPGQTGGD